MMLSRIFRLKGIAPFLSCLLQLWRKFRYENNQTRYKIQNFQLLAERHDLSKLILVFSVEGALLRSSTFFPYFMLVAFEAGSLIRASILFALYPIICLVNRDLSLRIMVMICFLGIRQDSFKATARAVFPKHLLEDVGLESFKVLERGGKRIGVTDLPLVMVETFLREYLEIDFVVGKEVKVFRGYFLGVMEKKQRFPIEKILRSGNTVGIGSFHESFEHDYLFSHCKEIYMVSEEDKRQWKPLSRDMYPRQLIFHDGRLAFKPGFVPMLVTFLWFPVGLILSIVRIMLGFFPYGIAFPLSAFTGIRLRVAKPKSRTNGKGQLYVCNHRTLLDPVILSIVLQTPLSAVTYSLSRVSELLSPIKTVRLRRDRDEDAKIMGNLLSKEDLVICPEGTTCREPYLLRFSPLFTELGREIIPVAVDSWVSMFYGTTAGGLKCMDSFFFLMNPCPGYAFEFLDTIVGGRTPAACAAAADNHGLKSKFEVANVVQTELGKALGFACTQLTRKDKYLFLTGS